MQRRRIRRSHMWLHNPRHLVMPSHDGRACFGTMRVLRGMWTFAGAEPWSPPWARNDNVSEYGLTSEVVA